MLPSHADWSMESWTVRGSDESSTKLEGSSQCDMDRRKMSARSSALSRCATLCTLSPSAEMRAFLGTTGLSDPKMLSIRFGGIDSRSLLVAALAKSGKTRLKFQSRRVYR